MNDWFKETTGRISDRDWTPAELGVIFIFLGGGAGLLLGLVIALKASPDPIWIAIALGGIFGGLLYGMRERTPVETKIIASPWIKDAAFGLAGGLVIFLLLPISFGTAQPPDHLFMLRVVATAMLGGYGGRSLMK